MRWWRSSSHIGSRQLTLSEMSPVNEQVLRRLHQHFGPTTAPDQRVLGIIDPQGEEEGKGQVVGCLLMRHWCVGCACSAAGGVVRRCGQRLGGGTSGVHKSAKTSTCASDSVVTLLCSAHSSGQVQAPWTVSGLLSGSGVTIVRNSLLFGGFMCYVDLSKQLVPGGLVNTGNYRSLRHSPSLSLTPLPA